MTEIDALEDTLNERCDRIESDIRELMQITAELNRKFDIVMQYITGQGGS